MKKLMKNRDLTEANLRPGDIILTVMRSFGERREDVGNFSDRFITAADFAHAVFYVGNGQVIKDGWQRKSSLQDVLQEAGSALVFRPKYLQEQMLQSIVQHAHAFLRRLYW